ncbi:thiol-disulfide oxidoreductase DCC family protein [Cerasibacillus terrae]|uniref:Thiol-disulfide oxidoreductase DCC family protein n=1 Tax=Cerasibacillus terrae TaxID=2498845 RepID=A0A5C8NRF4_9BACI|nr:thiol-disulfide oxidoreductase DCC family protein [Cerasibacillus terrae]TXL63697.1 thiol-disulfide oxidoreductase DCC family protein [Cerasibacillus terrae]
MEHPIILFDGQCHFCDQSVQFIIKHDAKGFFKFASQQGEIGQELLNAYEVPEEIDSIILLNNDKYYIKSSAALRICFHLTGGWKLFSVFLIIPSPVRDFFYNIIAQNRYRWFGKKESCQLPTKEIRKRFLDMK